MYSENPKLLFKIAGEILAGEGYHSKREMVNVIEGLVLENRRLRLSATPAQDLDTAIESAPEFPRTQASDPA